MVSDQKEDRQAVCGTVMLQCLATGCRHNSVNRSHGEVMFRCDYKHVQLDKFGSCVDYSPEEEKE